MNLGHQPVAVLTGGASGIGLSVAKAWIEEGGRAVILDVNQSNLEDAVAKLGASTRGVSVDVKDEDSVTVAFESISAVEGKIDALINCAGIGRPEPIATVSEENWTGMIDTHLHGTWRTCRSAYPLLKASSRAAVVNLSSIAASFGLPSRGSYSAAKAATEAMTRTLAVEWALDGIRANCVAPGYTRTSLVQSQIDTGDIDVDALTQRIPMQRLAMPREIAEAVLFLVKPESSYITGQSLLVDGGMSIDGNWY